MTSIKICTEQPFNTVHTGKIQHGTVVHSCTHLRSRRRLGTVWGGGGVAGRRVGAGPLGRRRPTAHREAVARGPAASHGGRAACGRGRHRRFLWHRVGRSLKKNNN